MFCYNILDVRNSSCGKVMFSQASVILSTGGGRQSLGRHPPRRPLQWTVRILLECILVEYKVGNNANIANFVCLWKIRILTPRYVFSLNICGGSATRSSSFSLSVPCMNSFSSLRWGSAMSTISYGIFLQSRIRIMWSWWHFICKEIEEVSSNLNWTFSFDCTERNFRSFSSNLKYLRRIKIALRSLRIKKG